MNCLVCTQPLPDNHAGTIDVCKRPSCRRQWRLFLYQRFAGSKNNPNGAIGAGNQPGISARYDIPKNLR